MSYIGRPKKSFDVIAYNKQKADALRKRGQCPTCFPHWKAVQRFQGLWVCPQCGDTLPTPPEYVALAMTSTTFETGGQ